MNSKLIQYVSKSILFAIIFSSIYINQNYSPSLFSLEKSINRFFTLFHISDDSKDVSFFI